MGVSFEWSLTQQENKNGDQADNSHAGSGDKDHESQLFMAIKNLIQLIRKQGAQDRSS